MYRLMDNKQVSSRNKEILANMLSLLGDSGALLATLIVLVLDNTIMKV